MTDFPVAKGKVRNASGHLGAFEVIVDDFAQATPSSHGALMFGPSRDNARSSCDIILDLTGGTALFPAADLRDGYLRADPGNPAAMLRAVLNARDLDRQLRKATLHRLRRHAVRPFPFRDRRLHPLPRSLSDIGHYAGGRSRGHRRQYLRRLRAMRGGLSNRRCVLRIASGRCADAQASCDADGLPRGRRRTTDRAGA